MDGGRVVVTLVRHLVPNLQMQLTYFDTDAVVLSREGMLRVVAVAGISASQFIISYFNHVIFVTSPLTE